METLKTSALLDRYKASSLRAFNTKWPDHYDHSPWVHFWVANWDRRIISELSSDIAALHILDVGCASGRLLETLAKAGATHLAGTDLAPRMVAIAQQRLAKIGVAADIRVSDAENVLPWPDEYFDAVTLTGVFHHFYHPTRALEQIHRVLYKDGRILILDPWFPSPIRQIINLGLTFLSHDGDYKFYAPSQVKKLLRSSGFDACCFKPTDWHSFMLVAVRT